MQRRQAIEAALFLPAMAALAAFVFAVGFVLIRAGNGALSAVYAMLRAAGLPHSPALALAVMATALLFLALAWVVFDGRARRRPKGRPSPG